MLNSLSALRKQNFLLGMRREGDAHSIRVICEKGFFDPWGSLSFYHIVSSELLIKIVVREWSDFLLD